MKTIEGKFRYRVSYEMRQRSGETRAITMPDGAFHLLYQAGHIPVIPRIGESVAFKDIIDLGAKWSRVVDVLHGISSEGSDVVEHWISVILADEDPPSIQER
ncbi:hypothetical protein [Pseudomonas lopnurensis]|uniref:hypothetical protein n=1 Tax=Pseudomonas lopnurensis TaxID=1477517 RepID=UPI0028AD4F40|nr:hypothetical protein [Pseudomonas lopnurensis]